jgi:hypothetical protein
MKLRTIFFASAFAIAPTLVLAQAGGYNSGAEVPGRADMSARRGSGANAPRTTGEARRPGGSGDAVTTGSDVPQDKPNLSNSPESSDTSQKIK